MQNPEQARERFSKRLTRNDVKKRSIVFPFSAVSGIFDFQVGRLVCLDVVESTRMAWNFICSFDTNEEMGSVVSIRCPQFMSEKGLKANDEVSFVRQDDDKVPWKKFKIEIRRNIRLCGQDIWGDLMV
ncbi:hypothetical protein CRYUN_Cryun18bG0102900 [Craigia yunnanensis]